MGLEQFMLYAHGSDLCREVVMRHAMANCFEALMGALFLDAGLEVSVSCTKTATVVTTKGAVWIREITTHLEIKLIQPNVLYSTC